MIFSEIRRLLARLWERGASSDGDGFFFIAYCVLLPIYLAPIFVTRLLPGLDLPFHLSLVDMLHKVDLPGSPYGAIFDGALRVSPYMGYLLVLWLLSFVLPVGLSHKLLFAAYVATLPLALSQLLSACRRSRIPALVGFPLCYNMAVHYGFMSFALSLPLLLYLLAGFARVLSSESPPPRALSQLGWLGGFSVALFLFHLLHYLFFLCVAGAAIVVTRSTMRRRGLALVGILPSLMFFGYWRIAERDEVAAAAPARGLSYGLDLLWNSRHEIHVPSRLGGLHLHMLKGFADGVDRRAAAAVIFLLLAFAVIGLCGFLRKRPPGPRAPIVWLGPIALVGGLLAYLTLPHHLREFDVMTLFPRFSVTAGAMLALIVPAALLRHEPRVLAACALSALGLDVYYGAELIRHYWFFGRETADFVKVLDSTPPGGKAMGLVFDRHSRILVNESILVGLPAYYPVERRAATSLVDILYCDMKHMPCRTKDRALRPPSPNPWAPQEFNPALALPYFDYVFVRRGPPPDRLFGRFTGDVEILAKAGSWTVYRKKPALTAPASGPAAPTRETAP